MRTAFLILFLVCFGSCQSQKQVYTLGTDIFGYQYQDSISNYVLHRDNKLISSRLDTLLDISHVRDTINHTDSYMVLSEPFFADKNLICFSISFRNSKTENGDWIFFCEKNESSFSIRGYFDIGKDQYFEAIEPESGKS